VQYVTTLYIPDFASSYGIPGTESALLVSFIGITNTLARIISGFIVDFLHVRSITLYLAAFSVITVGKIYFSVKYVMWRKYMYICFEIYNLHTPLLPYK
jgi:lipoprotein signal peptidase